jgi:hypothetical protein
VPRTTLCSGIRLKSRLVFHAPEDCSHTPGRHLLCTLPLESEPLLREVEDCWLPVAGGYSCHHPDAAGTMAEHWDRNREPVQLEHWHDPNAGTQAHHNKITRVLLQYNLSYLIFLRGGESLSLIGRRNKRRNPQCRGQHYEKSYQENETGKAPPASLRSQC